MVVLEVLDDPDSSIRELALSLIAEMLKNQVCSLMFTLCGYLKLLCLILMFHVLFLQRDTMEDSIEIVIEKLLHLTKDTISKVSLYQTIITFFVYIANFYVLSSCLMILNSKCRYQMKQSIA